MRHQGDANLNHYTLPLLNWPRRIGLAADVYLCNTMMEVYARNGRVPLARRLFEEMPLRDVVTWTSLLSSYVSAGDSPEAFHLFCQMRAEGLEVNQVTMAVLLRACYGSEDKVAGCQLQAFANKAGLQSHELLQNSILSMFSRLACFEEVMKFVIIQNRSIASWNILLSSYSFIGDVSRVVKCYRKMRLEVTPSNETLTLPISAFAKCEHLPGGREVHCNAIKT
ncbi:pentatricopeptide repeat-containing protein At4g02750-like isoform X1 [Zingiber officinale]|uniref:pentatricopeptide repeat-containing protein At4g02750-like isoform X1 n=1 Tax=Zingiber officinale TaxID=94328 RepID=UPI001C4B74B4|nr:pentatricopeptide repeat-containing protein At4g02750-like isoform X1 [Zingiber officinale]XP_042407222.1 pentatricopeptide repeat-containing protein At4g02750-like isoform X1 [Zingiber officinale]XP_042407223.1 pentatricopeptide repeat-containing protein At4g02750-like isoform X1 [Zingiber officinale]XP_042407224.1 pentatricopeptide repeat-containing protein At4g02750-like isoform X1 [Zingiber officinale]XP_042407226.1 pentatricopeptide repeat-containing protein At4g02750-like isoform X1 [Z